MPTDEERLAALNIKILAHEERDIKERKKRERYKGMSWIQVIQQEDEKWRLERLERGQREIFERLIFNKHRHLHHEWKDLFAEYFKALLSGEVVSIYSFLYKMKPSLEVLGKMIPTFILKERFIDR